MIFPNMFLMLLVSIISDSMPTKFQAGAAKRIITPKGSVYLAGWSNNRKSEGIHDELFARCILIDDGQIQIGFLCLDLLGVTRLQNLEIQRLCRKKGALPDHLIIMATHQHSGPDTIGLWGPDETTTGVDSEYIDWVCQQAAECIAEAKDKIEPAKISLAMTTIDEADRISINHRDPDLIDRDLGLIKIDRLNDTNIAMLVNFAMHPEVMKSDSRLITADFPSVIYRECDNKLGGITLFVNGALGGMISPDRTEGNFQEVERIGSFMTEKILEAAKSAVLQENIKLSHRSAKINIPLENLQFLSAIEKGILPKQMAIRDPKMPPNESRLIIPTVVRFIEIGDAQIATYPGEVLPKLGYQVKDRMDTKYRFIFGLADDELGYILDDQDFGRYPYEYESSMSISRTAGSLTTNAIIRLLGM